ncbi:MAG: beta strand repeat-containing protein, partial [Desulfovibrio fairfieldensis]
MLTKGAIGNLVNKYRAVLKKCGLLNVFGSLAVAGALVLGGAGLAVAAASWGPDKDVVITGTETLNNGEQSKNLTISGAANSLTVSSSTGHLYVSGATTLNDGGTLTLNTGPHGLLGTTDSAGEAADTWTGSFGMTGGTLAITDSQMQMDAVAISGGAATISGRIGGGTNWDDGAMLVGGLNGAATTVSGGKVTVDDYGQLVGGQVNISGGEVALNGDSGKDAILRSYGADNALTLSGDGKISVTASKYGVLTANAVNISGGTLDVAGNLTMAGALVKGQSLSDALKASGDATVNQTGGTVSVETGGALTVAEGVTYTQTGGTLDNKGTLTVNGLMDLTSDTATNTGAINVVNSATGSGHTGRLQISDTQLVAMVASGKIAVSGDSGAQTWGRIHLGENASVATNLLAATDTANKVFVGTHGSIQAQNLTLTGDNLAINADARIKANSLTLTPDTTNGDFTVTAGQLFLKGEDGSALNVAGTGGLSVDGSSQRAELKLGELSGDGAVNPGGSLNADITATGASAKVRVNAGTWTLAEGKTLDIQGGALTVGGGTDIDYAGNLPAALDVSKGTLKSAAAGQADHTTGINVLQNGVLAAASTTLMKDSTTIADNLNKIWLDNGGTLRVTGLNTISTTDMQAYKTALVAGGTGLINYGSATVTISDADKGSTENSIKGAAAEGTGTLLDGKTVEYAATSGAVTSSGNFGADTLAITGGDAAGNTVTANGDLTLLGDGTNLITADTGEVTEVAVAANKNLNLGSAGAVSKGGTLDSKVSLGNGSALNAAAAEYTVGDITAVADGNGTVTASAGATLNAGKIGDASGNAVNSVSASNGTVQADAIATKSLAVENGTVKAAGDITVDTIMSSSLTNGQIHSTDGNVTLTGGATQASGAIVADAGDITATGKDITATVGEELTLSAKEGTIAADNVTATNVQAKTLTASGAVSVNDGVLIATGTGADASSVGSLALNNAQAVVGDLSVSGAAALTNGTSLAAEKLTMTSGDLTVGSNADTKGGTTLAVDALNLSGNALLIDPAWGTASTNVAVGSFTNGNVTPDLSINGDVGVGMNSMAAIGTTDTSWLAGQVNAVTNGAGLTENGVDSVLGIYTAQVLGSGKGINVDGTQTTGSFTITADQLDFSGKSLLVVNADAALAPAGALSAAAASTANIADGAKLRIAGAEVGETYKVLGTNIADGGGTINKTGEAWSNANFSTDSLMVAGGAFDAATGTITTSLNSARNVLPLLDNELADVLDAGYLNHEIGTADKYLDSDVKGVRFLSRATSLKHIGGDARQAAVTIESAARMALV